MQNQEKIVAAIAAYLDAKTEFRVDFIDGKKTEQVSFRGAKCSVSFLQEIAAELAAAIAPHLEAGAGKPNWNDAPEWATHLAQDMHGQWHWFRGEPKPDGQYWLASKYYNQRAFIPNMNWRDTLQERPK